MGEASSAAPDRWNLRSVPEHLSQHYRDQGWWNDDTLGAMVAEGLGRMQAVGFRVRSHVHPWQGTFADVDRAGKPIGSSSIRRSLLPNWRIWEI